MGFIDKLDALAQAKAAQRRAEIERLLAENPGKLLRASQLVAPKTRPSAAPAPDLLAQARRVEVAGAAALCLSNCVPVHTAEPDTAAPATPAHPRGYCFPLPSGITAERAVPALEGALAFLTGDETLAGLRLEQLAFLDTETTGLAGASGTYAFLVGLGYFRRQPLEFVCEQFLMEDLCHEPAMLACLKERLDGFQALVTFNGKCFDVPLLRARFIINRMRVDLDRPHADLLPASRRIWRRRLGCCTLVNLETQILGHQRLHDIDSALIPQIYFEYLRGLRPAECLVPILDHNVQDVVTMGALLMVLTECAFAPEHAALREPHDMAAYGRLHRRRGSTDMACQYFERAALLSRDSQLTASAVHELALIYKKTGRLAEAAELWLAQTRRAGISDPASYIELAKLYEHHLRDYAAALELIAQAQQQLAIAEQLDTRCSGLQQEFAADLAKRRTRIERKARARR